MPKSLDHRLKETKGKSDQRTLTSAKKRNAIRTKLRAKNLPQLNDRDIRMPIVSKMRTEKMLRSNGFPSSRTWAAVPSEPPSHCEGSREPRINIQIKGTHKAREVPKFFAGSKRSSTKSRISQRKSAKEGGTVSIHLRLAGSGQTILAERVV